MSGPARLRAVPPAGFLPAAGESDQEDRARRWLQEVAGDDVLICRGRGPRHGFDPLVRGRPLKSTWSFPVGDEPGEPPERYRLVQVCPDCRLVWRELVTGGGGEIPEPAQWRMWRDERYKPPPGTGRIPSYMARREASRRLREDGTIAALAAQRKPKQVQQYVAASDIRAAQAGRRRSQP